MTNHYDDWERNCCRLPDKENPMSDTSDVQRIALVLPKEQVKKLKIVAAQYDTATSVVVRAFMETGMEYLGAGDEHVAEVVADAAAVELERRRATGKKAMESRYSKSKKKTTKKAAEKADEDTDTGDESRE